MNRGPKPKGQVSIGWSPEFAYAIGLLAADGCLSKDGRHIDLTSKDREQVSLFNKCLGINIKISKKYSGAGNLSFHSQFGDVLFYQFLMQIGMMPAKSKILSKVAIPKKFFVDFFRGYFDGDGSSCSHFDPAFPKSYRFYLSFTSASPAFVDWLRAEMFDMFGVKGYISYNKNTTYIQLKYAKREAVKICKRMYYSEAVPCLERKRLKILRSLRIIEGTPR